MSFNPATFDISQLSRATVKAMEQRDDIDHAPRIAPRAVSPDNARFVAHLRAAGERFDARRDDFARGKGATCRDLAEKLEHFGCWVSDKQAEFAYKLVGWSAGYGKPHPMEAAQQATQQPAQAPIAPPVAPTPAPAPQTRLPKLFDLMQRLSKLTIGDVTIARKNQDSLCWVKVKGIEQVVGKIEGGKLVLFTARFVAPGLVRVPASGDIGTTMPLLDALLRIEADPEAAAALHGKLSGRCSICSRDLTDPVSIERGIGPICLAKAGW